MTPCFPPLCSVSCASQLPVFSLLFICPVRGLQLFPASMQCTIRVAATSFLLLFFFLLFFFRLFNFPACHGFQLFPAKTVGVGISLTVNRIKLLYTFFFFRVMQGVAWFISVLVIGINMFFVAEYVVSCAPVCHSPPSSPHEHTKYRLYVQTSAEARPNLFSSWNPCSFSLADIPEKNRWIRALTCNDLFNLDIDAKYWKASYDIISELDSFANYFQANTENTEMVYYQHLRRLLPVLFYTPN